MDNLAFSKSVWGEPAPSHKALRLQGNSCVFEKRPADSGVCAGEKVTEEKRGDRERRTRRTRWCSERRTRKALMPGRLNEREWRGGSSTGRGRSSDGGEEQNSGRDGGGDGAGGDLGRVRVFGWRWWGRSSEDGRVRDLRGRRPGGWAGEEPRRWRGDRWRSLGTGDRAYMWPRERENILLLNSSSCNFISFPILF